MLQFSFLFLFCASICGFCGFASSTNGTPSVTFILNENGPLPKTNLPDNAPPPKNSQPEESNSQDDVQPQESSAQPEETHSQNIEQEQIFDENKLRALEDELRELENLPPKAAIVLESDNYLNGNCNPQ